MAYFNHAFKKTFVATKNGDGATNGISDLTGVQLGTDPANVLKPGEITFIDPKTFQVSPTPATDCCEFILAGGALMPNDKIGPFHGGYTESNKSKTIKSKYVSRLYRAPGNAAEPYITHVGYTPWTAANPPVSSNPGETAGTCCKQFLCGETYYLRLDLKGSAVMRYLDRNSYLTLEAYTGCCPDQPDDPLIAPVPVDPGIVMIAWAKQLLESTLLNPFVYPVVTWNDGLGNWTYYYPDNVDTTALPAAPPNTSYDNYENFSPVATVTDECAGIMMQGAYFETRFQNCTFQPTDFYEVEPVRIYASEVDYTGSPCEFDALCVGVQCYGLQVNGLGETVVRDVILSEAYRQNHLSTDLRIREITQGNSLVEAAGVDRAAIYDRIYLQHNIPRLYNPTGTFDNDQYLLEIVVEPGANSDAVWAALETWVTTCESDCLIEDLAAATGCDDSVVVPLPPLS